MGIDVVRRSCAGDGVVCLFSGKYPQDRELVCYRGKQAVSIWIDLERDTRQISIMRRGEMYGRYTFRDPEVCTSC